MESTHSHRGFTLIELLVVLAIISIVTAIVIVSQKSFDQTITLSATAYDIGLTIREAQNYGIGSENPGVSQFSGYGIDFNSSTPHQYALFQDTYPAVGSMGAGNPKYCHPQKDNPTDQSGDCAYVNGSSRLVKTYTIGNGITVSKLCYYQPGFPSHCNSPSSQMDVVFARPGTNAFFSYDGLNQAQISSGGGIASECIQLTSPQGGVSSITVNYVGEISTAHAACP